MITKNYIKMCEKAEEIQKIKSNKMGDWYNLKYDGVVALGEKYEYSIAEWDIRRLEGIWLPTQEQLQEIIQKYYQCNPNIKGLKCGDSINLFMLKRFLDFTAENRKLVWDINSLWLAFVMKEHWNKIWTGEEWVKV